MRGQSGIALVEILVVIAIIVLILLVVLPPFSSIKEGQVLDNAVENVISALNKARTQTLSSLESSEYGVHFESDQIVIFKGKVYSAADPDNESVEITSPATISDVTLGGVSGPEGELYFARLSGVPDKSGTVTVSVAGNSKIITISSTGTVSKN